MGKLEQKELQTLLQCIKKDPRVVIPPQVGYDAGVHFIGDKYLVVWRFLEQSPSSAP
jgi:hypothetical protein